MLRGSSNMKRDSVLSNRIGPLASIRQLNDGDLARLCGLSRAHVNRIKNGRTIPRVDTALAIARALRHRVRDVFWLSELPRT